MNLVKLFTRRMGYTPNLNDPKTFSEKMLIRKLYDRRGILPILTDKLESKNWIKNKCEAAPIPTLHVGYDYKPEEYPFIAKPNNYSGETYLVRDAEHWKQVQARFWEISDKPFGQEKGAWAYSQIPFLVLIEPVITNFTEVKFFCFDGVAKIVRLIGEREDFDSGLQPEGSRSHFTPDGTFIPVKQAHFPVGPEVFPEEIDLERLKACAESLSQGLDCVRLDLYWTPDQIYYGEHTFYPASGHNHWTPQEFDRVLGDFWTLPDFN